MKNKMKRIGIFDVGTCTLCVRHNCCTMNLSRARENVRELRFNHCWPNYYFPRDMDLGHAIPALWEIMGDTVNVPRTGTLQERCPRLFLSSLRTRNNHGTCNDVIIMLISQCILYFSIHTLETNTKSLFYLF